MTSKEAAAAAIAAETDEERTSKSGAAAAATATVSGRPEWELLQSESPTQLPQIECPPCTLRGSTLPVCGPLAQGGRSSRGGRPQHPQQSQQRQPQTVRSNRASELRRQRSQQRELLVVLESDTAAVNDLTSATATVDAEEIDHSDHDEEAVAADTGSVSTRESDDTGSDDADDSNDEAAAADAGGPTIDRGVPVVDLSKSSLVASLLKSSDSVIREVNDLFLDSLEIYTTQSLDETSAGSKKRANDGRTYNRSPLLGVSAAAAAGATSSTGGGLNVAKLQAQLLEASRQRDQLKWRIASLAHLMSTSSGALEQEPASPVDKDLSEAEPRRGLQPQPMPQSKSTSTSVGVQAGIDSDNELPRRQVADKATQQADEQLAALVDRVQTAAETCAELRLERAAARRELDAAKFDLRMASADAQEQQAALAELRRGLQLREDQIRELTVAKSSADADSGRLRSQLAEVRRQLDSAESSCQAELARNQRQRSQLASLEAKLASRMGELAAVTNALIEKRRSEDDLLALVQQLQRALTGSEETVGRLTEQLAEEQARIRASLLAERSQRLQRQAQTPPSPQQQPQPQTTPPQLKKSPPPPPETVGLLEQRMSELDARIGRLVAEARDGGGWRRLRQQEEQQRQQQQQQQPRTSDVVTSTPVDPTSSRAAAVADDASTMESLRQRTAQLEASNQQLSSDVRSLRGLCSELVSSRRQLKLRLSQAEQPTQSQSQAQSDIMASYLLETETLRALICSQVRAHSPSSSSSSLGVPQPSRPQRPLLAEELRHQQETVNRCWRAVERSFQLPHQTDDASGRAAGAYRDFYLNKRWPQSQLTRPGAAAAVSYSDQVLSGMRHSLTK